MKLSRESQVSPKNLGSQGITIARLSVGCEESRSSCEIPTWDPWAFQSLVTDREMLSRRIHWLSSAPAPETGGALCGQCACPMKGAQVAPFVLFSRNKESCLHAHPSDTFISALYFWYQECVLISGSCCLLWSLPLPHQPAKCTPLSLLLWAWLFSGRCWQAVLSVVTSTASALPYCRCAVESEHLCASSSSWSSQWWAGLRDSFLASKFQQVSHWLIPIFTARVVTVRKNFLLPHGLMGIASCDRLWRWKTTTAETSFSDNTVFPASIFGSWRAG